MRKLLVIDIPEKIKYTDAWELQKKLHYLRVNNVIDDTLILLEHQPVITLGKFGNEDNLLKSKEDLEKLGIDYHRVDRGGDITYHGPGQLVGYLIFRVEAVKNFVLKIENVLINVLSKYNIKADLDLKNPGVWIGDKKIASIGIAIKRRVSYHGFALNISNDLTPFSYIIPCGLKDKKVTSILQEVGFSPPINEVKEKVYFSFLEKFSFDAFEKINLSSYKEATIFDKLLEVQQSL